MAKTKLQLQHKAQKLARFRRRCDNEIPTRTPFVEDEDSDEVVGYQWLVRGKLHRVDGPAVEFVDADVEPLYYLYGRQVTAEEHKTLSARSPQQVGELDFSDAIDGNVVPKSKVEDNTDQLVAAAASTKSPPVKPKTPPVATKPAGDSEIDELMKLIQ